MKAFLNKIIPAPPTWATLARIGRARVVSLTILMPFIGYMIVFNDQLMHLFAVSTNYFPAELFHYPWLEAKPTADEITKGRLFEIYYGLTFLGVGSAIYAIRCPVLVKDHSSDRDYVRDSLHFLTRYQARKIGDELRSSKDKSPGLEGLVDQIDRTFDMIQTTGLKEKSSEFESAAKDLMAEHWNHENLFHPASRYAAATFYFLGFLGLLTPSLKMLWAVSEIYWG